MYFNDKADDDYDNDYDDDDGILIMGNNRPRHGTENHNSHIWCMVLVRAKRSRFYVENMFLERMINPNVLIAYRQSAVRSCAKSK